MPNVRFLVYIIQEDFLGLDSLPQSLGREWESLLTPEDNRKGKGRKIRKCSLIVPLKSSQYLQYQLLI